MEERDLDTTLKFFDVLERSGFPMFEVRKVLNSPGPCTAAECTVEHILEHIYAAVQLKQSRVNADRVSLVKNNCTVRECCPICFNSHKDARNPVWLMVDTTGVCEQCAEQQYPKLYELALRLERYVWRCEGNPVEMDAMLNGIPHPSELKQAHA